MTEALKCRNCGGPIRRENIRCPRCNSLTVTLGCGGNCLKCMKSGACVDSDKAEKPST